MTPGALRQQRGHSRWPAIDDSADMARKTGVEHPKETVSRSYGPRRCARFTRPRWVGTQACVSLLVMKRPSHVFSGGGWFHASDRLKSGNGTCYLPPCTTPKPRISARPTSPKCARWWSRRSPAVVPGSGCSAPARAAMPGTSATSTLPSSRRHPFRWACWRSCARPWIESTIPYRVEIVDLRDADARFRDAVHAEGIRWSA